METLSELGRRVICNIVDIHDKRSIFVRNKDAFIDRMKLYNNIFDVDKYIKVYKEELSTFESEEEYIKFLKDASNKLSADLTFRVARQIRIIQLFHKVNNITVDNSFNKPVSIRTQLDSKYKLRFTFESPLYEGFRFLCNYDSDLCDNAKEYMFSITKSKLISELNDIPLSIVSDRVKSDIDKSSVELGLSLISVLCPRFLNKNEICYIGKSEIQFITTLNKPVESLDRILTAVRDDWDDKETLNLDNISLEVYCEKPLAKNNSITLRDVVIGNDKGLYNVYNYDTPTLVRYLRRISGDKPTKYDKYFEYRGCEVKLLNYFSIVWR